MSDNNKVILAAVLEVGRQMVELIETQAELGQRLEPPLTLPSSNMRLAGPVLDTIVEVVRGLRDGTSLDHVKHTVKRLTANQEPWAELHGQLMFAHDVARQVDAVQARDKIESRLIAAVNSGRLTPMEEVEALVVLDRVIVRVDRKVAAGSTSFKDFDGAMAKIDNALSGATEAEIQAKFAKTTPQGREIARKILTKLKKAVIQADIDCEGSELA